MNSNDPLANLKDIHLPEAIHAWWPLAPGWWLLLILVSIALIAAITLLIHWHKRNAFRRHAQQELLALENSDLQNEALLEAVSILLRRTAISTSQASQQQLQQLQGSDWQQFLQQHMAADHAELIAIGRYRPSIHFERQALLDSCKHWIKEVKA